MKQIRMAKQAARSFDKWFRTVNDILAIIEVSLKESKEAADAKRD